MNRAIAPPLKNIVKRGFLKNREIKKIAEKIYRRLLSLRFEVTPCITTADSVFKNRGRENSRGILGELKVRSSTAMYSTCHYCLFKKQIDGESLMRLCFTNFSYLPKFLKTPGGLDSNQQ
ncbi:MAG TPA: hypothetical protein VEC36_14130 [Patescibacteria group bacterium]|nr:hypothetical protein [Patescibacteria group bacterium]